MVSVLDLKTEAGVNFQLHQTFALLVFFTVA